MFGEIWSSNPAMAGWLLLAALGLILLLVAAAWANRTPLDDHGDVTFTSSEPGPRDAPRHDGLDAGEVEDQDRRSPLP